MDDVDDRLDVDQLWLHELAAELVERLEQYLQRHAEFEAWIAANKLGEPDAPG